jgi:hypothetical protein
MERRQVTSPVYDHIEDFDTKFRAAWDVFAQTCSDAIAPEATFQVWFAHYLISQFGIDRVAREPIFNFRTFTSPYRDRFISPGRSSGEVKLDAVVTYRPGIHLPHYASRPDADEGGIGTLADLAIIAELKVASTASGGLSHTDVCKDFWKLSMLLDECDRRDLPTSLAYVGVLDNNPNKPYNYAHLARRLEREGFDPRVALLRSPTTTP